MGNDLAGAFTASRRRFQASLAEIQAPIYDPITETIIGGTARYALGPTVAVRGGLHYTDYNRPARPFANTKTLVGVGALEYVSSLGNTLGIEVAEAKGDAPVPEIVDPTHQFVNNDFRQYDVGIVGTMHVTPALQVAGRVGRTQRHYTELPGRDFNGPTWFIQALWFPTPKTTLAFETAKTIGSIIDIGAGHVVGKVWAFGPGWAPTAKLNFQARFVHQHQVFEGDPEAELGLVPVRQEFVRGYRLGAYWEYDRRWHYQLSFEHGERESNLLGRNYRFNAGIAQVRFVF